ncbi:hypothetical protein [Streptomyces geranii]|uniref:hypothetical protein n=1 Tax=Streptomyces geranii TaxID=2058923 RepID=UPI000D027C1B|nr:hypothetical protein [Streptomyces geranii]
MAVPSPDEMLYQVVGDLAVLGNRVKVLEDQDLATAVSGIQQTLGDIHEAIEELRPVGEDGEGAGPGTAPDWTKVDKDEARELWDWLIFWCRDVLRPMYGLQVWRPCWYQHPELRIMLTWLCAHWHWSYEKKAPPTRAAEWHTRWWPFVKDFMVRELEGCGYPVADRKMLHPIEFRVLDPSKPDDRTPAVDENAFEDGYLSEYVIEHISRRPDPPEKSDD